MVNFFKAEDKEKKGKKYEVNRKNRTMVDFNPILLIITLAIESIIN